MVEVGFFVFLVHILTEVLTISTPGFVLDLRVRGAGSWFFFGIVS